ncbi:MAG: SGNH/GDSL hydrolase family protein [Thermoanaerobaculia bacterium]
MHPDLIQRARWVAGTAGGLMILVALLADELGLDHSPNFGAGETLLLIAGVGVLAVALAGPRFQTLYRGAAILLLNTLVVIGVLELTLIAYSTLTGTSLAPTGLIDSLSDHYRGLSYYAAKEWGEQYWDENDRGAAQHYQPYVGWRTAPFAGETLNVDNDGIRRTPDTACDQPTAYKIFILGGSAMWGWGAPDWGTIPAYLQVELAAQREEPVCVVNLGENAFVSDQELVELVVHLRAGERPDLVIFYDGVNDVLAAHETGRPGLHQNFRLIAGRIEGTPGPLLAWLQQLNTVQLAYRLTRGREARKRDRAPIDAPVLAGKIVDNYLGLADVVDGLAQSYGFDVLFFWQPYILMGGKPLTAEERAIVESLDMILELEPDLADLYTETYRRIAAQVSQRERLEDLSGLFDTEEGLLWIDTWGHVTPVGNKIVARAMVPFIVEQWPVGDPRQQGPAPPVGR